MSDSQWHAVLGAVLRPLLYIVLWVLVIYWIKLALFKLIPDGKVKTFLFKRRGVHGK